jgi:hypothetical protein
MPDPTTRPYEVQTLSPSGRAWWGLTRWPGVDEALGEAESLRSRKHTSAWDLRIIHRPTGEVVANLQGSRPGDARPSPAA